MAISNCLFSSTLKIPMEFPTLYVLVKPAGRQIIVLTGATIHSRTAVS